MQWELYGRILSLSLCSILVFTCILILRNGGSRTLSAVVGIIGFCIAVGYGAYSSGGIGNPATGWLIALPLIGALVGGKSGGIFAFIFSLMTGLGLFYIETRFGAPTNLTPAEFIPNQDRLHQIGQLIIVSLSVISLFKQIKFSESQLSDTVIKLLDEVEARKQAEQEAELATKIKSEFLANMSHEIRTPMNGVIGVLNILEKENLSKKQAQYLSLAKSSSKTLMVVINDILDLSKIESGKLELEKICFNLSTLIKDIEQAMKLSADAKELAFSCHANFCADYVVGDPIRIRQIIDNLVGNAIKFTREGRVEIAISLRQEGKLYQLSCTVSDTGIGIPANKLKLLFSPFLQMETSTTRRFGGSGLGLAISKHLLTMMNGEIEVKSEQHVGSHFSFNLTMEVPTQGDLNHEPLYKRTPSLAVDKDSYLPVLLVEDNEINIMVAQAILENFPIHVDVAKNGMQAIEMLDRNFKSEQSNYQAVFMDCQMPKMDGYEASKILKSRTEFKGLPIIAMTANAMKGDKEKCLAAGMSDYISKPVEPDTVAEKLSLWLKLKPLP